MKRIIAIILAALMVFAAAASAMGEENKIWKKGDQGEKVTWIQTRLKELEYLEKEPDGIFDEETEMALMAFQWDQGLLKSGMADSITMKVLETATETKTEAHSCYDLDYWEEAVCYEAEYAPSATASMAMPSATSNKADSWKWNTEAPCCGGRS